MAIRVAVSGDSVTTFEDLDENELGNVYLDNGIYYTVVSTDERYVGHGFDPLRYELVRYLLAVVGVLVAGVGTALLWYRSDD